MTQWQWSGASSPSPNAQFVVVAPHPDDEILAAAGLMRWAADAGASVEIVAVTDGEASHRASRRIGPEELVARRAEERRDALACLGLSFVPVHRLGLPDAGVVGHVRDLAQYLSKAIGPETTLIVPWAHDVHPDHEAVARAGLRAASLVGATCWQVPIWSLVAGRFDASAAESLALGAYSKHKEAAIRCFRTQLVALGPDPEDGPVVHPHELDVLMSDVELVLTGARA